MTDSSTTIDQAVEMPIRANQLNRFRRVFLQRKLVLFGIIILAIVFIAAVFSPLIAPHDPFRGNMMDSLQPPSAKYMLGTDIQGRDTFSRLVYGARTALLAGFVTVGVAAITGIFFGLLAGFFGGAINTVIMRIVDAMMCFPMLLLALLISAILGGGLQNVIIALAIANNARVRSCHVRYHPERQGK